MPETALSILRLIALKWDVRRDEYGGSVRFQLTKQFDLPPQLGTRMKNLKDDGKPARRSITLLRREISHFAQTDSGNEQEREPRTAADESSVVTRKNPSQPGDRQHRNRCETPATIDFTGTPRFRQDKQRRNDRDKE